VTGLLATILALVIGTPLSGVHGTASWYQDPKHPDGLYAAAGPALRVGDWRGRTVQVCAGSCVTVRLTDWCACPKRVIDLSSDAFSRLAPLSRGLVRVTVSWGGSQPLPPTDTNPIAPEPSGGAVWPTVMGGHSMRAF
jgi:hypothetical protein